MTPSRPVGQIRGTIPRTFWNWFEAPPDDKTIDDLHRQLGKYYELALTFTMIAGLLNILAIFDAIEGPAYGYGLPVNEESKAPEQAPGQAAQTAAPKSETPPVAVPAKSTPQPVTK
jgi:hypothetical protein